jgi:hypothetical protein
MLAVGAAPVPPVPANQAPPPRLVRPDISLVVSDEVRGADGVRRARVLQIGFRNGKPLPTEVIRESDDPENEYFTAGEIRANRYLVSMRGGVLDLREKKLINTEQDGELVRSDDTKVTYWIAGENRDPGLFTFEYATGTLTRIEKLKRPRIPAGVKRSPDNAKAINWVDGELFLHNDGQKPKSLGTGFKTDRATGVQVGSGFSTFPVVWLDDDLILTQRETGKLVTVTLDGKVTDVVTIKDFSKNGSLGLMHDHAGSIIYYAGETNYKIDPVNKTATPADWGGLGHGFEMAWEPDEDGCYKFRHNGKDIGRCACWPYDAVAAPGVLAVPSRDSRKKFAVWSAATGEWTTLELPWAGRVLGWIK